MIRNVAVILLLCLALIPAAATAQTINGVGQYQGNPFLMYHDWWSVYGSNLSNRTFSSNGSPNNCGGATGYTVVLSYSIYGGPWPGGFSTAYSCGSNNPGWWYESPTQINFFADPTPPGGYFASWGPGQVRVCNNFGTCGPDKPVWIAGGPQT